jgi:hypothetical protein
MVTFYDDDGEELKPVSYKDFISQGKNRMDKWLLTNEATNKEEKAFQDAIKSQRASQLKKAANEYQRLTRSTDKSDTLSNDTDSLL